MAYAPRILIIDDDAGVLNLFANVLAEDGYYVTAVATGRHAMWALRETAFDLAIVDMGLPDGDGPFLIREMLSEAPHLKVLATSGDMAQAMRSLASLAGATAVFGKPITPRKLRNVVYAALDASYSWRASSA